MIKIDKTLRKSIAVVFCFCTLMSFSAYSQFTSFVSLKQHPTLPSFTSNGICNTIAYYPEGALSYYEYHDTGNPSLTILRGCFVYNQGGTLEMTFVLPDYIYATDYVQVAGTDLVFFCGYKNISVNYPDNIGIVGWFNLNSSQITIDYVPIDEIYRFTKVNYLICDDKYHLTAIGQKHDDVHKYGIFYCGDVHLLSTNPQVYYNLYYVRDGEYLFDIIQTQNYMAFVGVDSEMGGLCIRRESFCNFGNPAELNNIYGFPFAEDIGLQALVSTYMGNKLHRVGDEIAVCTPVLIYEGNSQVIYRFIDVATLTMTGSQVHPIVDKVTVWDMTYVSDYSLLCPLIASDPGNAYSLTTPVIHMDPYSNTSYTAVYMYDPYYMYRNIDCLNASYNSTQHYLLGGPHVWYLKKANHPTSNNDCNKVSEIDIRLHPTVDVVTDKDPLNGGDEKYGTTVILYPNYEQLNTLCGPE